MQIDGIQSNHGENTRQQRRNLQFRRQNPRHNACESTGNGRKKKSRRHAVARDKRRGGYSRTERKTAFNRKVGNVKYAESDVDPERHQSPHQALRHGRNQNISHVTNLVWKRRF